MMNTFAVVLLLLMGTGWVLAVGGCAAAHATPPRELNLDLGNKMALKLTVAPRTVMKAARLLRGGPRGVMASAGAAEGSQSD